MTAPSLLARAYRPRWLVILTLALLQALALGAAVAGTRLAFASLDTGVLSTVALAMIGGAGLGLALLRPALRTLAETLGQDFTAEVRQAIFDHAMRQPPDRIARRRRGYLILRLTGDMAALKDGLALGLQPLVQGAALVPAALAVLALIDGRFGLIVGALVLGLAGVALLLLPRMRLAHAALRDQRARLAADMVERIPLAPDLARMGRRERELEHLGETARSVRESAVARLIRVEVLRALPGMLIGLVAVYILWDGAARGLLAGTIAAALAALGLIAHTLVDLAGAMDRLIGWQVARDKLVQALAEPAAPDRGAAQARIAGRPVRLGLTAVPGLVDPAVVDLPPGTSARLTTHDPDLLLRALLRQTEDERIAVTLDDIPLPDLTPGSIRRSVGVIGLDPVVLKGSLRRNLCLALAERPSDEVLANRIARAGLGPALDSLGGLDERISEGGRCLSPANRLRLSALQNAVVRPGVLVVAAEAQGLPPEVSQYLTRSRASVVQIEAV
jgi:ABC-type multidrug transport system fused ATPase/permease subunit